MKEIAILFFSVVLQNASFTLVSRARNSKSLVYHGIASILSNGLWLVVIRQVVININDTTMMWTYLVAAVIGSVLMHWFAMEFLEKKKQPFDDSIVEVDDWVVSRANPTIDRFFKDKPHRVSKVVDRDTIFIEGFGPDVSFYRLALKVVRKASLWDKLRRYAGDYLSGRKWD